MKKIFYRLSVSHDNKLSIDKYEVEDTEEEMEDFASFEEYVNYHKDEAVAEANQRFASAIIIEDEHIKEFATFFNLS